MGTRNGSLIGDSVTLGMRHIFNGILTDAYQIIGVQILNPRFEVVGFIPAVDVVHLDIGSYQAIAPSSMFTEIGTYHDVWQIIPTPAAANRNITFDISIVNVLGEGPPNFDSLLSCTLADLDACKLKRNYLWPVWSVLSNGWYLPDIMIQDHIDTAITWAQRVLGIPLRQMKVLTKPYSASQTPTNPVKGVDYQEDGALIQWSAIEAGHWNGIRLPHAGITKILGVRGVYGGKSIYDIPNEWVQGNELKNGWLSMRPTTIGNIASLVDNSGQFLDTTLLEACGNTSVPGFWAIDYTYGEDTYPKEICDLIMRKAAVLLLDQLGMAISRGISSRSANVDGLGSSVSLLANAERTQFGALATRYSDALDERNLLGMRQYYKTPTVFVI